jgi:hypothetical protein
VAFDVFGCFHVIFEEQKLSSLKNFEEKLFVVAVNYFPENNSRKLI